MSTSTVAKERHESMRHTLRNRAKGGHSPLVRAPMYVARPIGTKRIGLWTPGTLGIRPWHHRGWRRPAQRATRPWPQRW